MDAKLERSGEDYAVRLTAADVQALGLTEGATVEVTAKSQLGPGQSTSRRHVNGMPVYTMAEMIAEARRLGPDAEPPSVDWGPDRGSEIIDDDDPR